MKQLFSIFVLLLSVFGAAADTKSVDAANADYDHELYKQALTAYLAQEKTGEVSSDLYYNIGNTYYRLKDNTHAILYYERALLANPGNSDARFNLDFVRQRAGIDQDAGSNILLVWLDAAVNRLSSNTWAVIALVSFWLLLVAVGLYLWAGSNAWRKVGFFGGIVLLALFIASLSSSLHNRNLAADRTAAIIVGSNPTLSVSPREPKDKSEVAFEVPAGSKVKIVDSVNNGKVVWLRVATLNDREAWIKKSDIEII